ncbi:DNA repair protein RadC [Opitutales bacterium ASA1]|uniref:RadC family protein n=1 Tax=Congregicoccus parvus TaxID=3081749 RepID=UPI002B30E693|nr:DNA repair protein RadC [Opitutales bacterium ASA1]
MDTPSIPPPPVRLRDLAIGERPQERLERHGPAALSEIELLALLLRKGTRTHDVLAIAQRMLADAGSLDGLLRWTEADLRRIPGVGRVKAAQLVTVLEIARRVRNGASSAEPVFRDGAQVFAHFEMLARGLSVEKFWVLCLNRKNRLVRLHEATSGTASSSLVHPREVFREAIRLGASAVICVHNHPSGDPAPSSADIQVTRQLREASRAVDIDLLDHVVVGQKSTDPTGRGYYSFRDAGLL